mgnify:CR=1 FL=1
MSHWLGHHSLIKLDLKSFVQVHIQSLFQLNHIQSISFFLFSSEKVQSDLYCITFLVTTSLPCLTTTTPFYRGFVSSWTCEIDKWVCYLSLEVKHQMLVSWMLCLNWSYFCLFVNENRFEFNEYSIDCESIFISIRFIVMLLLLLAVLSLMVKMFFDSNFMCCFCWIGLLMHDVANKINEENLSNKSTDFYQ